MASELTAELIWAKVQEHFTQNNPFPDRDFGKVLKDFHPQGLENGILGLLCVLPRSASSFEKDYRPIIQEFIRSEFGAELQILAITYDRFEAEEKKRKEIAETEFLDRRLLTKFKLPIALHEELCSYFWNDRNLRDHLILVFGREENEGALSPSAVTRIINVAESLSINYKQVADLFLDLGRELNSPGKRKVEKPEGMMKHWLSQMKPEKLMSEPSETITDETKQPPIAALERNSAASRNSDTSLHKFESQEEPSEYFLGGLEIAAQDLHEYKAMLDDTQKSAGELQNVLTIKPRQTPAISRQSRPGRFFLEQNFVRFTIGSTDKSHVGQQRIIKISIRAKDQNGRKVDGELSIIPSVDKGLPGPTEIECWFVILRWLSELHKPIEDNIIYFKLNDLLREMKLSICGKNQKRIMEALERIKQTGYRSVYGFQVRETEGIKAIKRDFNLIEELTTVTQVHRGGETTVVGVRVNQLIVSNLNNKYVAPISHPEWNNFRTASKILYNNVVARAYGLRDSEYLVYDYHREFVPLLGIEPTESSQIRASVNSYFSELINADVVERVEILRGSENVAIRVYPASKYKGRALRPSTATAG